VSWLEVTYRNGERDHPDLGCSFAGKELWRVEIHITLEDLFTEAMQQWLKVEVSPRLPKYGIIEITVIK
jgi:hypothetical protein